MFGGFAEAPPSRRRRLVHALQCGGEGGYASHHHSRGSGFQCGGEGGYASHHHSRGSGFRVWGL